MAAKKNEPTAWVGWVFFAGLLMMIAGMLHGLSGLVALFDDQTYIAHGGRLLVLDYTQWGWVHLIWGALLFFGGLAVLNGETWGRVVAVFAGTLSIMAAMVFLPTYPLWSLLLITIDILFLYALIVHGKEIAQD